MKLRRFFTSMGGALLLACAASAADTNLWPSVMIIDGHTYSNVTLIRRSPATITIRHSGGLATIPIWRLGTNLQTWLAYNPTQAAAFLKQEAEAQAIADAQRQEEKAAKQKADALAEKCNAAVPFHGRILQMLPDGMLVMITGRGEGHYSDDYRPTADSPTWYVEPRFNLTDDRCIDLWAFRQGTHEYVAVTGAPCTIQSWWACKVNTVNILQ
jgi:hypothetical protein